MEEKTAKLTQRPRKRSAGEWKPVFLTALAGCGSVRAACRAADISRPAAYDWRERDDAFAEAWDAAIEDFGDTLMEEAVRRALDASDRLLSELLKAHKPELFDRARRMELVPRLDVGKLSEAELLELAQTGTVTPRA